MTADPLSFFTIDRGTASTAAALIAPYGGRFRLLASAAAPRDVELEVILGDLVERVRGMEPAALPGIDDWPSWARLEVATRRPLRILCSAATEGHADAIARAFRGGGWEVAGKLTGERLDPRTGTEACLRPDLDAIVIGAADPSGPDERPGISSVAAVVAAAAIRRPGLRIILSGGARAWSEDLPADRTFEGPPARTDEGTAVTPLRDLAISTSARWAADRVGGPFVADARIAFREGVASLASLVDRAVDAVDIGHSAGTRVVATPDGGIRQLVEADAALVHRRAVSDDGEADAILRWCVIRAEQGALRDRLRNLRLAPWADASEDAARLRLAALRGALGRLATAWTSAGTGLIGSGAHWARPARRLAAAPHDAWPVTDLLLASGGAFAAIPPAVASVALLDAFRRPGALSMLWDHARILAPIGILPSGSDRRRLLADLLDDAFLPLASALVVSDLRSGRHPGTLRVTSPLEATEATIAAGTLRTIDLPPGLVARAEIEAREPVWLGIRGRHIAIQLAGGIGGLLVDTREMPLRLPDQAERRRSLIEGWERPLWTRAAA